MLVNDLSDDILEFIKSKSDTRKEVLDTYTDLIDELEHLNEIRHDNIPTIIQATILEICNYKEVKDCYDEFKEEFNKDKDLYIYKMIENLKEYCSKEGICPICGEDLLSYSELEDRGEYLGFPSKENIITLYCPNNCK